jgi:hypothetical protein
MLAALYWVFVFASATLGGITSGYFMRKVGTAAGVSPEADADDVSPLTLITACAAIATAISAGVGCGVAMELGEVKFGLISTVVTVPIVCLSWFILVGLLKLVERLLQGLYAKL